jgi:hypothetical protein
MDEVSSNQMIPSPKQSDSPPEFDSPFPQSTVDPGPDTINSNSQEHRHVVKQYPDNPVQSSPRNRQPQSQYYIVFSVAGVERSNVKNPIIRFDAKVHSIVPIPLNYILLTVSRQTSLVSVPS